MSVQLRGGNTAEDPRLDRLVQFDERSRNFPIRAVIGDKKPRSYTWSVPALLDQGSEGACVGFSIAHEAAARPVAVPSIDYTVARALYKRAQELDPWYGEDYEGTSVLAGVKAAMEKGWYSEYRWGFGLNDLVLAVGYKGPVVIGINWYRDMFYPDSDGYIKPGGYLAGGHAILVHSVNVKREEVWLWNSWSKDWGANGRARLRFADLDRLLQEDGECLVPVKRTK